MHFRGDVAGILLHWCNCIFTFRRHVSSADVTTTDTVMYRNPGHVVPNSEQRECRTTPQHAKHGLIPILSPHLPFIPYGSWRHSARRKNSCKARGGRFWIKGFVLTGQGS